ncbi:hypothetical protein [Clostridium faecium]|uniref:Lipoprotein n=1 Tax=Clostridium faecium TaxID=2762223 RepID=A0ABR8YVC6_9CLOT|nr:hypothetical protein [Clostridium faecium]MBD8048227.1 hypothetical protein [Clostridium faecium]
MNKRKLITKILILFIIFYMIFYNSNIKFYTNEGKWALINYKYEEFYDKEEYIYVIRLNKPIAHIEKYKMEKENVVNIIAKPEEDIIISFLGETELYNIEKRDGIDVKDEYFLNPIEFSFNIDAYKVKRKNFVFRVKNNKKNIISFKNKKIINIILN